MHLSKQSLMSLAVFFVVAWSQSERPKPVPIEIPDYFVCIQNYPGGAAQMHNAIDRGDPDAILCGLGFEWGRGIESAEMQLLYRYYRATGMEPEGLDERIRRIDRRQLYLRLLNWHDFSPELTMFEIDARRCPIFDDIATELLLRAEPSENMRCLPRRGWQR